MDTIVLGTITLVDTITCGTVKVAGDNVKVGTILIPNFTETQSASTQYDLISGGGPSTIYVPINGFNLISGGNP